MPPLNAQPVCDAPQLRRLLYDRLRFVDRGTTVPNRCAAGMRCPERVGCFRCEAVGDNCSTIEAATCLSREHQQDAALRAQLYVQATHTN
jgi:hypothetical protein